MAENIGSHTYLSLSLSEDVSGIDFEIKCVSCRDDEPDSGKLTTHFFNSTQSKRGVNIICVLFLSDPGVPVVRSMGPVLCHSLRNILQT